MGGVSVCLSVCHMLYHAVTNEHQITRFSQMGRAVILVFFPDQISYGSSRKLSETGVGLFFFLSHLGWHTLPSHASAEACLTGWPNAQPQGKAQCSVARHHQDNLMVCVVCSCCTTSPYRQVCRAKGEIGSGETLCHDIYPARPITTVSLAANTYCMMDVHSSCAPRTMGPRVQFSGVLEQSH